MFSGRSIDILHAAYFRALIVSVCIRVGKQSDLCDINNVDWAPTLNMGHEQIKNTASASARGDRATKRAKNLLIEIKKPKRRKTTTQASARGQLDQALDILESSGHSDIVQGIIQGRFCFYCNKNC